MENPSTTNSTPIRWGIIGLGKIAHKFAQDLALVPNCQLIAVASRSLDKANAFASKYGSKYAFDNYQALVACEAVDAVYIATPHTRHYEDTLMALDSRKAVLCEKPFGLRTEQVEAMISKAQSSNIFLMEAMWTRFFPLIEHAITKVKAGEIGTIRTLRADFGFHAEFDHESRVFNKALGGGSLMDVGIYPLFLSLLLLGYPEQVEASASKRDNGVDESCYMLLHYPNRVKAQLYSSIIAKTEVEASIFGDKGFLKLQSRFHHPKKLSWGDYYETPKEMSDDYMGFGYHYEIAHVNECLRKGLDESPLMTHELSLQLIRLLDAVKKEISLSYE